MIRKQAKDYNVALSGTVEVESEIGDFAFDPIEGTLIFPEKIKGKFYALPVEEQKEFIEQLMKAVDDWRENFGSQEPEKERLLSSLRDPLKENSVIDGEVQAMWFIETKYGSIRIKEDGANWEDESDAECVKKLSEAERKQLAADIRQFVRENAAQKSLKFEYAISHPVEELLGLIEYADEDCEEA